MTTPDPARVKALFGEVLDAREQHRHEDAQRILDNADPDLREQVRTLLAAHERASGALLDHPTTHNNASAPPDPASLTPTIIGYEIAEEIGHGGFGIVYRARQRTPIDRPVAIKVLRRELVSDDAIARFRAESTLLARMNHDSIARVYDAGLTDQGQPFVSMQLNDA
jgi:serine/threonine protein kinase